MILDFRKRSIKSPLHLNPACVQIRHLEPQGFGVVQPFVGAELVLAGLERHPVAVQAALGGAVLQSLQGQFNFEQHITATV
jgi:hypothetical protein